MRRLLPLALALLALTAAVAQTVHAAPGGAPAGAGGGRAPGPLAVGRPPPALNLSRISGSDETTLEGLRGRVVVLDFWATWCGPCQAVMPALDRLHTQHHGRGLSVIGLSAESDAAIRAHIARVPVAYTIARDTGGTLRSYGVRAIPTMVVLDRAGKVREIFVGVDGPAMQRLNGLVTQLLGEPAP